MDVGDYQEDGILRPTRSVRIRRISWISEMVVHARLLAENGKVRNECLSARSDLSIGAFIMRIDFSEKHRCWESN